MADQIIRQVPMFDPLEFRLTRGYVTLVDPVDADLSTMKWVAFDCKGNAYAGRTKRKADLKTTCLHRVIMERVLGRPLTSVEDVDHINHNTLDNRRTNLRVATRSENLRNADKNTRNRSGYKGVRRHQQNNSFTAQITVNGVTRHLGCFPTAELAFAAYCAAGRELHGEFFNPGATPTNGGGE